MNTRRLAGLLATGFLAGWAYRQFHQQRAIPVPPPSVAERRALLERAAPLLRLPTAPDRAPEVLADGSGLRCPATGRMYPYHDGVLDLLGDGLDFTPTQHLLNTPLTAWAYDRFRDEIMSIFGLPAFAVEVAQTQRTLQAQPGDSVLDLACGQGNFTVEWAKRVGPGGLVIGLDIAPAMLARAVVHVRQWGLTNVLLIRGDAQRLPLGDGQIAKVNCSGGFHQLPDLPQALREIARVSRLGAVLTASTFAEGPADQFASVKRWLQQRAAFHFVPVEQLGSQLAGVGYGDYAWELPGGWFGYVAARRGDTA